MQIFINDKVFECPAGATLPEVLEANNIKTENIAIAVDFSVIPRSDWNKTVLQDGNKIIIIKAVQGGWFDFRFMIYDFRFQISLNRKL